VNRFAELLDSLVFTASRNGKLRLMRDYFATTPDPERGWALAALTGALSFREVKPAQVRDLALRRMDGELFGWSYDFVGDLAETVALAWPERRGANRVPPLSEIVETLRAAVRADAGALLETWLDALDATGRWALLKLVTGGLRVGVSARLAKTAVAELGGVEPNEVEEVWHGLAPPYLDLFAWLEKRGAKPETGAAPTFCPLMLAHAAVAEDLIALEPGEYAAEWKWDGIRVQLVARGGGKRLYSRAGEDIGGAFPELVEAMPDGIVLDGELLIRRGETVAPFNDLQQRLNRKTPSASMLREHPAAVRLYDMLEEGGENLRPLAFCERRRRLEDWYRAAPRPLLDLSPLVPFQSWDELAALRAAARENGIEGLMLKRIRSPYVPGRPKGEWWKWKRDPFTVDAVLMYAQRGHGKRSSFYSDYTFGAWRDGELVPIGKAYSGYTDEELLQLDRWIRNNTTGRFGPVREVAPGIVLEVAFDSVHRSTRHRSGLALRFPRIHRIRWDKPAAEAETLAEVEKLVT
jgi:DNA ligase-1